MITLHGPKAYIRAFLCLPRVIAGILRSYDEYVNYILFESNYRGKADDNG